MPRLTLHALLGCICVVSACAVRWTQSAPAGPLALVCAHDFLTARGYSVDKASSRNSHFSAHRARACEWRNNARAYTQEFLDARLRIVAGDTVLEITAGAGWGTDFINQEQGHTGPTAPRPAPSVLAESDSILRRCGRTA